MLINMSFSGIQKDAHERTNEGESDLHARAHLSYTPASKSRT
jgi:hypothetical protein